MFGAAVPERNPRTRSSRALKLRAIGDLGERNAVRAEYRYFWDTWAIKAHTARSRLQPLLRRATGWPTRFVRYHTQNGALFYSDNAHAETTYVSRNRQLSTFNNFGLGGKLTYTAKTVPGQYELNAQRRGSSCMRFNYKRLHRHPHRQPVLVQRRLLQLYVSATF